jgi:hypothetical protein
MPSGNLIAGRAFRVRENTKEKARSNRAEGQSHSGREECGDWRGNDARGFDYRWGRLLSGGAT